MDKVRLVIGYGNPGIRFAKTRGNVGFIFIDYAIFNAVNTFPSTTFREWTTKSKYQFIVSNQEPLTLVVKPRTYARDFEKTSRTLFNFYNPEIDDFYIIYPDLGTPLGEYEVSKNFGRYTPENVRKLQDTIDTGDFWKVRLGAGGSLGNLERQDETLNQDLNNLEYGFIKAVADKLAPELKIVTGVMS